MNLDQQKSILTIALLAAFADGTKDDAEREEIRRIAQSLAGDAGMADLPRIYQDVLLKRTSVQAAVQGLSDPMHRIRPANPSTPNEQLQAPSCPRKPSCTPCLKRFPIRAPVSPARAGSTARNSRLN